MKPSFLLIGLGNVGKQYASTRHNIGFLALDEAAKETGAGKFADTPKFLSLLSETTIDNVPVLLVKPTTLMNRSGEAIRKLVEFYKLDPAKEILVCCDDIDLPLGTHRLRLTGGPGTHNGLKSIVDIFGENFPRLRIGLGSHPPEMDLAAWVLSALTNEEKKVLEPSMKSLVRAANEVMKSTK